MTSTKYLILILIKTHLLLLVIILASYLVEKYSTWKLLFKMFNLKKSKEMARGAAAFHTFLYFTFSFGILIYDGYIKNRTPSEFLFTNWLIVMLILSGIFRLCYYIFTAKDPKKLGEHYDL